jgi:hypothetical protein
MKFFIPAAKSPEDGEHVFKSIFDFAKSNGIPVIEGRRIFRITFHHNGVNQEAEVGRIFQPMGEPVVAILKGITYLVCTTTRGVARGEPIMVGDNEIRAFEDFEDFVPQTQASH